MTNTKLLERLHDISTNLSDDDRNAYNYALKHSDEDFSKSPIAGMRFASLVLEIQREIYADEAKKSGRGNALAAVKSILKNAPDTNKCLKFSYTNNGKQYICDGCMAVILNTPFAGLPELPDTMQYMNVDGCIPKDDGIEIALPDVTSLKTYVKMKKAKKEYDVLKGKTGILYYDFGENLPLVDAERLINMLDIFGACNATQHGTMIKFVSDVGTGILCAHRPINRLERRKTEI